MSAKPQQLGPPDVGTPPSTIPMGLRVLAMALRALFIGALVVVTVRVSSPQRDPFVRLRDPRRSDQACAGICGLPVDRDPPFHASQGRRGISDLGLPRSRGRPARIGGRLRHLVTCARTPRASSGNKGRSRSGRGCNEFDPKPNSHVLLAATHQARYVLLSAPSAGEAIAVAGAARKPGSSGTGSAGMAAPSGLVSTCWNTPRAV